MFNVMQCATAKFHFLCDNKFFKYFKFSFESGTKEILKNLNKISI